MKKIQELSEKQRQDFVNVTMLNIWEESIIKLLSMNKAELEERDKAVNFFAERYGISRNSPLADMYAFFILGVERGMEY